MKIHDNRNAININPDTNGIETNLPNQAQADPIFRIDTAIHASCGHALAIYNFM